jgi:hypothetical protein
MVLPRPSATAAKKLPLLGTTLGASAVANTAIGAAAVVPIAGTALTLTEGTWLVTAAANILMGAGAGLCDVYLRAGGAAAGRPATFQLAAAAQGGGAVPAIRQAVAPGTTVAVDLAAFANAACTAQWAGGAGGFATTGVTAVREG